MSKIDITTQEWNDLVFEGRNKNYGGYVLRNTSNKRHIIALVIVLVVALLLFYAPKIFDILMPVGDGTVTVDVNTTEIAVLDEPKDVLEEPIEIPEVKQLPELRKTIQFTEPKIVPKEEVTQQVTNDDVFRDSAAVSTHTQEGSTNVEIPPDVVVQGPEKPAEDNKQYQIFEVEQKPEPPYDLYKRIGKELRYPAAMQENGITGRVTIQFLVSKTGKITNVKVLKSTVPPVGDKEAIRVIEELPNWIPGKQNGQPVQVLYTIPINFTLQ